MVVVMFIVFVIVFLLVTLLALTCVPIADLPHVRRGRAEDPLHVRQQHQLQPEVQGVRLELQRRLPKLPRLVRSPSSFHNFC